jgi:hypothetical protein
MDIGLLAQYLLFSQILMKLEFSLLISEKFSNIEKELHANPFSGSLFVPCGEREGQKDRHDRDDSRSSQFCARA